MEELAQAWRTMMSRHTRSPEVGATGQVLLARWSEPHRRYHDLRHLQDVLANVDALAEHADHPDAVRMAAWYHDAIYDGTPEDEERSALAAEAELAALGVPAEVVAAVGRLVRMTVEHDPAPEDHDGQVLSDADLAALAVPPEQYRRNSAAIRQEYLHVSDDMFRTGRAHVIEMLLAEPKLFRTPLGQVRWETAARDNLRAELATLIAE